MKNGTTKANSPDVHGGRGASRILLAEDNNEMRNLLAWSLRKQGYDVTTCPDGVCLLRKLGIGDDTSSQKFDLVISDIRMPGVTGMEVLEGKRIFDELPPIILITAFPDKNTIAEAKRLGAATVLAKPFDVDDLLGHVTRLLPLANRVEKQARPAPTRLNFPLEVTFRRRKAIPAVDDYIRERASKLDQFAENIQQCRVIIDELHKDDSKRHQYQVEVILDVPGKPIIGTYHSDEGENEENLYYAVYISFARVYRELKQAMAKQQNYRKGKQMNYKITKEENQ